MISPCPEVQELRKIREEFAFSRDFVANLIGVSAQVIYRAERKGAIPILAHRRAIQRFNKTVREFEKESSDE